MCCAGKKSIRPGKFLPGIPRKKQPVAILRTPRQAIDTGGHPGCTSKRRMRRESGRRTYIIAT